MVMILKARKKKGTVKKSTVIYTVIYTYNSK